MEERDESQGVMKEWYQVFINTLKQLSKYKRTTAGNMENKDYAVVGSSDESKRLIEELCYELDEEYALRKELDTERDPEAWFDKKTNETLEELYEAGIIEEPTPEDYNNAHRVIQESMRNGIVEEAEQTAGELNAETDELAASEQNEFYLKEEV